MRFKRLAGLGAALVVFLSGGQATAQQWDLGLCGDWEIGAHALYFTPITCPYAYANRFTQFQVADIFDGQKGQAQVIPCRAEWGFRVFGNYLEDCFFAGVSYQWFEVTTTRSIVAVAPASLVIQGGSLNGAGRATGQVGIEYQNVDVRAGKYFLKGCCSSLYLYGNVRWVDLSHRRTARFATPNGVIFQDVREKSQLEGGAIGIGFGVDSAIWCDFGAFIDGNILGVIGNRSVKDIRFRSRFAGSITETVQSYPSETCVIPEVDFRVGINYTYACGCWQMVGEIGYEVDYFWHGSVLPDLTGGILATGAREFVPVCEDLGFSGLFVGGRLIF